MLTGGTIAQGEPAVKERRSFLQTKALEPMWRLMRGKRRLAATMPSV
jgi:hypothetical protein